MRATAVAKNGRVVHRKMADRRFSEVGQAQPWGQGTADVAGEGTGARGFARLRTLLDGLDVVSPDAGAEAPAGEAPVVSAESPALVRRRRLHAANGTVAGGSSLEVRRKTATSRNHLIVGGSVGTITAAEHLSPGP